MVGTDRADDAIDLDTRHFDHVFDRCAGLGMTSYLHLESYRRGGDL